MVQRWEEQIEARFMFQQDLCVLQHIVTPTPPGHRGVQWTSFTPKLQDVAYTQNTEKMAVK